MTRSTRTISKKATSRTDGCRTALALVAFAIGLLAGRVAAAEQTPSQVVDGLAGQVIPILQDKSLNSDQKRERIEQIAYTAMDFDTLSKLVLARNWSKFSPAQQAEFVKEFKRHLSVTYGRNVDNYHNEKVQIVGEREATRGDVVVQTKILRGSRSEDVLVDYRLRKRDGEWKIIDVVVEGVSLVSNFRSQFEDIVAQGGPEKLLAQLKEKNLTGEPLSGPTPKS
jgi:phospholipid transport system substrate-binding protein